MMKYKTVALASARVEDKNGTFRGSLSVDAANKALASIGQTIQTEATGGWKFEQLYSVPVTAFATIGCLAQLFGGAKGNQASTTYYPNFLVFSREE